MSAKTAIAAVVVVAVAVVCVSLGFWQIRRWHLKHALNKEMRAALAAPPVDATRRLPPLETVRGHRVVLRGRYDERRQFLLAGRPHEGSPGVEVVTPLLPESGGPAVLVNRGWLYAADAATALPQQFPEPGTREVTGLAAPFLAARGWGALHAVLRDTVELWSGRALDPDSVARRLPYAIAAYVVRALPGRGAPLRPLRTVPEPLNEMMHVSYAVQWFLFAAIALLGPLAFAWSRRRRPPPGTDRADPDLSFRPPAR